MPKLQRSQKGMTQVAWILAIVFLISAFIIMVRLVPPYLESMSVAKSLESLAEEPNIDRMSSYKMKELLGRRFYINDVKSVDAKNLLVTRENGKMVFDVSYEVRVHAIGNVDIVLKFDKKAMTE